MSGVRLGLAPVNWNNDDVPEWGQMRPYAELVAATARLGYDGLEEGTGAPQEAEELRALVDRHGVAVCGAYRWVRLSEAAVAEQEIAGAVEQARRLAAVGAGALLVAEHWTDARRAMAGRGVGRPELGLPPRALSTLCENLNLLGRRVRDLGLRLAMHHHVGTPVETPEEVASVMNGTDPAVVGLCLDTGHTVYGGGDALEAARRYASRVVYLHAKDVDAKALRDTRANGEGLLDGLRRGVFSPLYATPPDRSTVDIEAVGAVLRGAGFQGWVIMECDRNPRIGDPDAEAAAARDRLAQAFGGRVGHRG